MHNNCNMHNKAISLNSLDTFISICCFCKSAPDNEVLSFHSQYITNKLWNQTAASTYFIFIELNKLQHTKLFWVPWNLWRILIEFKHMQRAIQRDNALMRRFLHTFTFIRLIELHRHYTICRYTRVNACCMNCNGRLKSQNTRGENIT